VIDNTLHPAQLLPHKHKSLSIPLCRILTISRCRRPTSEHAFVSIGLNSRRQSTVIRTDGRAYKQHGWSPHTLSHICVNNALTRD